MLALAAGALTARAGLINSSFETSDFTGWETTGAASIEDGSFTAPTDGLYQAFMNSSTGSVPADALSAFFGVASLPGNDAGPATEGSGILQTFTLSSGLSLSFNYKLVTNEGGFFDNAIYVVDGTVTVLGTSDTVAQQPDGVPDYPFGLPYQTVTVNLSAGTHTIGFGAYDTGDTVVDTGLVVDNVGEAVPVPEPSTAMFGLGLLGLGLWRVARSRRRIQVCPQGGQSQQPGK